MLKLVPSGLDGMKNIIADPDNIDTSVSYISAAAARDGSVLVAYIPPDHTGEVKVDLSALSKPHHWNRRTGCVAFGL